MNLTRLSPDVSAAKQGVVSQFMRCLDRERENSAKGLVKGKTISDTHGEGKNKHDYV